MKQIKLPFLTLMIAMFLVGCGSNPQKNISKSLDSVLLRFNYEKGDSYNLSMQLNQDTDGAMSVIMDMEMSQKITDVINGEFLSEVRIVKIKMDMKGGGMSMNYDSSKNDGELDQVGIIMKKEMAPMLAAVVTMRSNNLGKLIESKVVPDTPATTSLAEQTNNVTYPINAVRIGESWSINKKEKGMDMTFYYKVRSITNKIVLLDLSGTIKGGADGTISGEMKIDRVSGVPMTSKIEMDMDVKGVNSKASISLNLVKQ